MHFFHKMKSYCILVRHHNGRNVGVNIANYVASLVAICRMHKNYCSSVAILYL